MMTKAAAFNRELGLKINREIWNGRRFDKIPEYFAEEFVADYSPTFVRHGRHHVQEAVEHAHAAFEDFREEIKTIVADDERVVLHFTIRGRHTGQWGPLPGTGKAVAFDEIVIMTVRDGKVVHQGGRDRQRHRSAPGRRDASPAAVTRGYVLAGGGDGPRRPGAAEM
jgi:predicted ester cyclase